MLIRENIIREMCIHKNFLPRKFPAIRYFIHVVSFLNPVTNSKLFNLLFSIHTCALDTLRSNLVVPCYFCYREVMMREREEGLGEEEEAPGRQEVLYWQPL